MILKFGLTSRPTVPKPAWGAALPLTLLHQVWSWHQSLSLRCQQPHHSRSSPGKGGAHQKLSLLGFDETICLTPFPYVALFPIPYLESLPQIIVQFTNLNWSDSQYLTWSTQTSLKNAEKGIALVISRLCSSWPRFWFCGHRGDHQIAFCTRTTSLCLAKCVISIWMIRKCFISIKWSAKINQPIAFCKYSPLLFVYAKCVISIWMIRKLLCQKKSDQQNVWSAFEWSENYILYSHHNKVVLTFPLYVEIWDALNWKWEKFLDR